MSRQARVSAEVLNRPFEFSSLDIKDKVKTGVILARKALGAVMGSESSKQLSDSTHQEIIRKVSSSEEEATNGQEVPVEHVSHDDRDELEIQNEGKSTSSPKGREYGGLFQI